LVFINQICDSYNKALYDRQNHTFSEIKLDYIFPLNKHGTGTLFTYYFCIYIEKLILGVHTNNSEICFSALLQNGFFNSLPHLAKFLGTFVFAAIADQIITKQYLGVTTTRKIMQSIGKFTNCNLLY
jgi:hypothetical protein